jgi:phospholipid/cholesterol/gamma-HCH transport system substrate-binding protein
MKPMSERNPVAVGAVGIGLIIAVVLAAFQAENLPVIGGGTTYRAAFHDAAGIAPDNEVRMAGVKVGEVTDVRLANSSDGPYVRVSFRIEADVRLGRNSEAHIRIKTVLGQKYLALESLGTGRLDEAAEIPPDKTSSPFDVLQAVKSLAKEVGEIDTAQLAAAFSALSSSFADTPAGVTQSLASLAKLSKSMADRDTELRNLLVHARSVSDVIAARDEELRRLIADADALVAELSRRREAIHRLLVTTDALAVQVSGLVADNRTRLDPALAQMRTVLATLQANRDGLDRVLKSLVPFLTGVSNASGTGRWVDTYIWGVTILGAEVQ